MSWPPPPLSTPPPLPLLCPAGGHSYPAGGPAAVPPPQGSEQPLHGAAGLHGVRLAGVPAAGLNNAEAWPRASWTQPGGGSRFPWVEGRLSGWCEEKPSPGSGGEYRREGGRLLLQEVVGGGCGGGQIRFPGSTLLGVSA